MSGEHEVQRGATATAAAGWGRLPERGTMGAIRLMGAIYHLLGRRVSRAVLLGIAAYFMAFNATARRASRTYLETLWRTPEGPRVLGHEPGLADVFRHIHAFSVNTFDRMVAWSGRLDDITFEHEGSEHLFALAGEGRGAILVGAHLGSFDMMRMLAEKYGLVVNVLMFTRHATRINAFLEALDPERRVRVLEIQPGSMQAAFAIKQCVERGEFVGILADRIHPGGRDRPTEVDFLGRATVFPLTPFLLGALLGCPMLAASCLRLDDGTYLARVRPLGTGDLAAPVARRARAARARAMLEDWVGGLERECLRAPLQWFNFFDYWQDREAGDA